MAPKRQQEEPSGEDDLDTKKRLKTDEVDATELVLETLEGSSLDETLDTFIQNHTNAEVAVLRLLRRYNFDLDTLKYKLNARGLKVSFSNVKWAQIAPLIGLNPALHLKDAESFAVSRARIPLGDFKAILQDINEAGSQYGHLRNHEVEEARSRYIATLFNKTISWFKSMIVNTPESLLEGTLTSQGRIEHQFKVMGSCTIVFVEVKLQLGNKREHMNAIAQVIAEADACESANRRCGRPTPVFGVLCDGETFEVFRLDKIGRFYRGMFPFINLSGDRIAFELTLPKLEGSREESYSLALKPICEVFFWLFLSGYCSGLQSFLKESKAKADTKGKSRISTDEWEVALGKATAAKVKAEQASQVASTDILEAESFAAEARRCLDESVSLIPYPYREYIDLTAIDDNKALAV